jgi:arabinose-5-phosphate isomerase
MTQKMGLFRQFIPEAAQAQSHNDRRLHDYNQNMVIKQITHESILASGQQTLDTEAQALIALNARLGQPFVLAVQSMLACTGRVVVCGLGKTGHVGRKIAATLASTGTPAFFMHAAEALHGDMGMLSSGDLLLALSHSGSGTEILTVLQSAHRLGNRVIALTGHPDSELAKLSDIHLDVSVELEACPLNLAPTSSTTAAIAMGDALAVACLQARGFDAQDFARSHPGGQLGRRLLTRVSDVMRQGSALPTVLAHTSMTETLEEMSRKGMGMAVVVDNLGTPIGIFTDGDLRRLLEQRGDIRHLFAKDGMSPSPKVIDANMLAIDAATAMDQRKITQMLVCSPEGRLIGALHMHDLMAAKVI